MTNSVRRIPLPSTPGARLLFASLLCLASAVAGEDPAAHGEGVHHEEAAEEESRSGPAPSAKSQAPANLHSQDDATSAHKPESHGDSHGSHGSEPARATEGHATDTHEPPPEHGHEEMPHSGDALSPEPHALDEDHSKEQSTTPHADSPSGTHGKRHAVAHPPSRPPLDSGTLAGPLRRREFVWNAKKGPLRLLSDVVVGPSQTLEIGPGTEIWIAPRDREPAGAGDWIDSQYVSLIVDGGTLRVLGTPKRPVHFLPQRRGPAPHWGGIRVVDAHAASQVEIAWADIPRAHVGIDLDRSTATIRHVVVRDASIGMRVTGGASPEISNSILFGAKVAGLHSERSGPVVRGCLFVGNPGTGARFDGIGLARLESNAFWNNAAGDLLRPPPKVGGWTGDSIVRPDLFGNVRTNPVFRASALHAHLLARKTDSLRYAPIWKRRLPENPRGEGPWALSPFSPLLDRGSLSPLCRDHDGSRCDIGLWGGKD